MRLVVRIYPSIPHLPGSRCASDRTVPLAIARRCTEPGFALDGAEVIVQEKLDGSCVAVARRDGELLALGREGRPCAESGNEARRWFAAWVAEHRTRFDFVREGEVLAGEWLALVHGTRYALDHEPFVPFDLIAGAKTGAGAGAGAGARATVDTVAARLSGSGLSMPRVVHRGAPISIADAVEKLGARGLHGAIDPPEGLVYRVERGGEVIHIAKWVRPEKRDGALLPENSGAPALYHWQPK
ncbi:MAG: RNA ligase family protein [Labilithrix sp.]